MREKKAKFEQLDKYSNVQLRDKVRYMIQQSEKVPCFCCFYHKEPQKLWDTHKSMLL